MDRRRDVDRERQRLSSRIVHAVRIVRIGVHEGEHRLGLRRDESVEGFHHERRLEHLCFLVYFHLVPELLGRHGRQVRGVLTRDADAARILQEPLGTVQAFRRQLVVPEAPQQLRDDDVCPLVTLSQFPHVSADDRDVVPAVTDHPVAQGEDRVRILLYPNDAELAPRSRGRSEARKDQRPPPCPKHHEHDLFFYIIVPLLQGLRHCLFVRAVLDRVHLERLVRLRLEIVLQRLQRRLQEIVVWRRVLLRLRRGRQLAVEVVQVLRVGEMPSRVLMAGPSIDDHMYPARHRRLHEALVPLGERREATLVGEEDVGRKKKRTHRLPEPAIQRELRGQIGRHLQQHVQRTVVLR
mmetsp:Transcript_15884/g.60503  ORF Transcript_15884/g.60503 Transcript_15884/m.60503 type:complete len:352 (+) Transcript_15884:1471-2526(+)